MTGPRTVSGLVNLTAEPSMHFVPAETFANPPQPAVHLIVRGNEILIPAGAGSIVVPSADLQVDWFHHQHYLGDLDGQPLYAAAAHPEASRELEQLGDWSRLRDQLEQLHHNQFQLAGRAMQVVRWHRHHQFCGQCGSPTQVSETDRARICEQCDLHYYPRLSPCVIGLVVKDGQLLLARGVRHPEGMFSAIAGFIEPGESAEEAFAREVREEVGVAVHNIRYCHSQPWPFPGQLMLGFVADYHSGELRADQREILEAGWFSVDNLPITPPESTISGRLIKDFIHGQKGQR